MFVSAIRTEHAVTRICQTIEVSPSGYYKWLKCNISLRKAEDKYLYEEIKKIHDESKEIYGSPRIEKKLRQNGTKTSPKRVARIMRENGLRSKVKKKFKATTNSKHNLPVAENLLQQNFTTIELNQVWTSDITYIWTSEGWLYLVIVLDIFSRSVIGWKVNNTLNKDFVYETIIKSIKSRKPTKDLIFHSDRGSQYASHEVRKLLKKYHIKQSMSRSGNCYDNAITETFFHSLKTEMVYHNKFKTRKEAELKIFEYIEIFYNRSRLHSSLKYQTPIEFEKNYFMNNYLLT
jgi:putative transposase